MRTPRSAARALILLASAGLAVVPAASGAATAVKLELQPKVALRDVPLDVRVSGLDPGERVTIRGEEHSTRGRLWRSSLTARAGGDGTIALPSALVEGLMLAVGKEPHGDTYPSARSTIRVSVVDGGRTLATGTAVRILRPAGVRVRHPRLKATSIYGDYFIPPGRPSGAPILFLGGSEGGLPFPAAPSLLAARGHPVLALAYFSEPGLPAQLHNVPLEYFRRGLEWLAAQPEARGRGIVVAGASRGGEAALLIGATYPELVAGVIALVPSDSVVPSPDDPMDDAWMVDGKPIDPQPIQLGRIAGPIFAVGAVHDALWPSGQAVISIRQRLPRSSPRPTILDYAHAGHAVGTIVPDIATVTQAKTRYGWLSFGGTPTADERAREQAWPRMLAWLARFR